MALTFKQGLLCPSGKQQILREILDHFLCSVVTRVTFDKMQEKHQKNQTTTQILNDTETKIKKYRTSLKIQQQKIWKWTNKSIINDRIHLKIFFFFLYLKKSLTSLKEIQKKLQKKRKKEKCPLSFGIFRNMVFKHNYPVPPVSESRGVPWAWWTDEQTDLWIMLCLIYDFTLKQKNPYAK